MYVLVLIIKLAELLKVYYLLLMLLYKHDPMHSLILTLNIAVRLDVGLIVTILTTCLFWWIFFYREHRLQDHMGPQDLRLVKFTAWFVS